MGEYVGGYEDWLRQRSVPAPAPAGPAPAPPAKNAPRPKAAQKGRLSYMEQREFDGLPERIEALGTEEAQAQAAIAAPDFYKESADAIARALGRLDEVRAALQAAYARWDELDSKRESGRV